MHPLLRLPSLLPFVVVLTLFFSRHVLGAECWTSPVSPSSRAIAGKGRLEQKKTRACDRGQTVFRRRSILIRKELNQQWQQQQQPSGRSSSSSSLSPSLLFGQRLRGGGDAASSSPLSLASLGILGVLGRIRKLPAYVGASKTRCLITLLISILGESLSTSLNKYAKEHNYAPALVAALCLYLCTVMGFNMCLAKIEVGIAYAIWSATGTLIVSGVGIFFFGESCDWAKLTCLILIVTGVVGLNLRP